MHDFSHCGLYFNHIFFKLQGSVGRLLVFPVIPLLQSHWNHHSYQCGIISQPLDRYITWCIISYIIDISYCFGINFIEGTFVLFMYVLGGWKLKVESGLTLKKDDTTVYHIFKFFNDRVSAAAVNIVRLYLREKKQFDLIHCALPFRGQKTHRKVQPDKEQSKEVWQR